MIDAFHNEIHEGDMVAYICSSSSPFMVAARVLEVFPEKIKVAPAGSDNVWLRSHNRIVLYRDSTDRKSNAHYSP
jgi:hypothetical protein